ncbi:hypothetical protein [Nitrospira sp. BLG_1]|uniref:hypothetical protein n=1 Tax=Nitrospira sp. BLG_1 TaxID=3395883 RepID=UPI0039BCE23B
MGMTHEERRIRRKQIASDVLAGKKPSEVCKKYQCSSAYAYDACREHGVPYRCYEQKNPSTLKIAKLLLDGFGQSDVARQLGVTRQRIGQVAKKMREVGFQF